MPLNFVCMMWIKCYLQVNTNAGINIKYQAHQNSGRNIEFYGPEILLDKTHLKMRENIHFKWHRLMSKSTLPLVPNIFITLTLQTPNINLRIGNEESFQKMYTFTLVLPFVFGIGLFEWKYAAKQRNLKV